MSLDFYKIDLKNELNEFSGPELPSGREYQFIMPTVYKDAHVFCFLASVAHCQYGR